MPATNKSGYTVYEYLSYAAQHPGWDTVYGSMTTQCRGRIGVHWRTNGNQFTVESLDTSVNAIWGTDGIVAASTCRLRSAASS